jgi:hypothetical protein
MVETDTDGVKNSLRRRNFWVNELQVDEAITGSFSQTIKGDFAVGGNIAVTGSSTLTGSCTISKLTTGNATIDYNYMNYANGKGTYISNVKTDCVISGGMWVIGSSAASATPAVVIRPAAVNSLNPLGICLATTGSNSAPLVLVQGFYMGTTGEGALADASINAGDPICMGSGAKLNTVLTATAANTARGNCIMGAGSNGATLIYLR